MRDSERPKRPLGERLLSLFFAILDGSGAFFRKLVWPIEALFKRVLGFFFKRLDSSVDEDSWSYRFRSALAAPFVKLGQFLFLGIDAANDQDSILFKIRNAIYWPFIQIGILVGRVLAILNLDRLFRPLWKWVLRPLCYPFIAIVNFAFAFYYSRSKLFLWLSVPILLLAIGLGYVIFSVRHQDRPRITQRYRQALQTALEQQDFATAGLYQQKLKQLGASIDQFELQRADELLKKGEVVEAFNAVKLLAPEDRLGIPAGHFWLAIHYLGQAPFDQDKLGISVPERAELALKHLDILEASGAKSIEVTLLRTLGLTVLGKTAEAKDTLVSQRNDHLPAALLRLKLDFQTGDSASAKTDAAAVSRLFARDLKAQASADAEMYQLWFLSEVLMERTVEAEAIAQKWYNKYPENVDAKNALVSLRVSRFDRRYPAATTNELAELAKMFVDTIRLCDANQLDPFKQRLTLIFQSTQKSDRKAIELFKQLQNVPDLPAPMLEFFGTSAAYINNYQAARRYLKQSVEKDPSVQIAWNNYAYVIDEGFPEEREFALELVNKAVEMNPKDVHARDTRATILKKMGRYLEAKKDLDYILSVEPRNMSAKRAMAEVAEKMGQQ